MVGTFLCSCISNIHFTSSSLSSPELRLTSNGNDLTESNENISVNMEISGTTTEADVTIKVNEYFMKAPYIHTHSTINDINYPYFIHHILQTTLSGLVNSWRTGQVCLVTVYIHSNHDCVFLAWITK